MKRKIYVIMFLILISISMPIVSFARTYINEEGITDNTNTEEDDESEDEEESDDSGDGETEPTEPTTENVGPGGAIDPETGDSTGEDVSYTDSFETINGRKYWVGWRKYHYNFTATPTARKGEEVTYTYHIINTTTGANETRTGSAIAKGYGLYSMDYNKHILGLLYYMSRKIAGNNYLSSYVPNDVIEFNADGTQIEQEYRLMDVACKEVADRIIETFYSSDYEQGKFKEFWEGSFTGDKANILGKLQSEFYCNAYAVNAIRKLEQMDFPFDEVTSKERAALYGMIFSIMESRYRDKNLNGKTNLQLKVEEGDLWPFLVNITNLNQITRNKTTGAYEPAPEWPDIDTIVDGAYQWMYYYDSKFETSTSASTITSLMVQNEADDEVDEADWEEEYLELTNESEFPYLNAADLQIFYNNVAKVRSTFKKSKENSQGIFGAEEVYDITSEVSYSAAMQDMKEAMVSICNGTDISKVWKGLTTENIARTYMMAKNIMENERVQEEFAYYNIGTNVINATPGLKGNEYMLVDFERVKLEQPLKVKDTNGNTVKTYADTDKDGLYDRDELGKDGETFEYYDITKFIEKMVLAELYGKNQAGVTDAEKQRIMTNFKKNLIRRRKDDSASDESRGSVLSSANTVDPKEQAEYYLNCFKREDTNGELYAKEEDAETAKIKVELYAFDSNPIFKDTDFDGVPDGKGYAELQRLGNEYGRDSRTGRVMYNNLNAHMKVDLEPQNNEVRGEMRTSSWYSSGEVDTHMDYRYFFMNNKNYYDELSTMSLMLCNTLEHNGNSGSGDLENLTTLFRRIGLKKWNDESEVEIKVAKYGNTGEVKYVVGENEIEYTHNYTEKTISKKVKLIVVKSIDVGKDNIEKIGSDRNNINQHELFEGLAKAIYDKEFKGQEFCYWITGYNTGGAVANVLAAKMIDKGLYYVPKGGIGTSSNAYITYDNGQKSTQSKHWQVISNVYCYTFGAPYTVYNGGEITEEENTISSKYASIFNVVSNGDIYGFILPNEFKWGRYGVTCYKVHEEHKKISNESEIDKQQELKEMKINLVNLIKDVFDVYENDNMFKDNYYSRDYGSTQETNIQKLLNYFLQNQNIPISVTNGIRNNATLKSRYIVLINFLNRQRKFINEGKDEKIYYELSKKILPEDISFIVNTENNRTREIVKVKDMNEELLIQLKNVGEWYCNNIATYQFYSDSHGVTYNKDKYENASTPAQARFDEYANLNGYTGNDRFSNNIRERVEGKREGARALYYAKDLDVDGRPHYDGIIEDDSFELNDGSAYNVSGEGDYNNGAYTDGLYRFGDDCSDFATAVILMTSKGNRGQTATISSASRAGQRGLKLHETNTEMFNNDNRTLTSLNNTAKAMEQLGYHLIDIDSDTVLIPGDILMTTNAKWKHTEFYYGYRYRVEIDESGRRIVTDELERVQPTNTTYYSTFGWGNTHASFPSSDNYFTRERNRWYLGSDRERYYSRLYRKETEELNLKAVREMVDHE